MTLFKKYITFFFKNYALITPISTEHLENKNSLLLKPMLFRIFKNDNLITRK